jgi:spermidine synthase
MPARALYAESHPQQGSTLAGESLFRRDTKIFLVSVLILYLELILIRWIGTEIRIFAYLGNLILVVCFFGVGLGCYLASRPPAPAKLGINLLLLAVLVANPLHRDWLDPRWATAALSAFEDSPVFVKLVGGTWINGVAALIVVGVIVYLIAFSFVPLGQSLGRELQEHPHSIRAYSVNIAGSLVGVWLFNALCWAATPAVWWFGLLSFLLIVWALMGCGSTTTSVCAIVATIVVYLGAATSTLTLWSPYQKLTVTPHYIGEGASRVQQGYMVDVNGVYYQYMLDRSEKFLRAHASWFNPTTLVADSYNNPFWFKPHPRRVLVVGAGTGNDVATALRYGAERVDGVEIDPCIYALGRELHPERPYDSARVQMTINDARAFFKQATGPYDVVWFAWLDSHTLGSSYNNLRLDHYVYTRESLEEAKRLLAPGGVIFINFAAERSWIVDRLFVLMKQTFGHDPIAYLAHGKGDLALIGYSEAGDLGKPTTADRDFLQTHQAQLPQSTRITTDDWPYLYLERAKIPKLHLVVSIAIVIAVLLVRRGLMGNEQTMDWHFFALGAAFLLLEVQTVSRATLLFGMTWVVNAIVISAVLIMILLSNLVAWRWPRFPRWTIIAGLAATVTALALVPLDWFNALTGAAKLVTASAFLTAPVFFAGLIFIQSFATCPDKARALGSNLLGALVGGLLESVSFVTGIRALVILVGVFYLIAILRAPRQFGVEHSGVAP